MAIIFNEDPNHFIYSRTAAGRTSVTEDDLRDFIRQYKDTNISDFLVCVNASMPFYPTKSMTSAIDRYNEWEARGIQSSDPVAACVGLLRSICSSGTDLFGIWLDEIKKCGMRGWVSVRMNDIHSAEDPDAFLPGDFYKAHPEYRRTSYRRSCTHPEYTLDYSFPQVREHYLSLIGETLDTFDCDGIELDYMREPFCFAIGREYDGLAIMTEFVGNVVSLVRKAEKRRGHRILLAARMPDSPKNALRLGFDVIEWMERGYLDRLFVTPHWSSSDGDMQIDLWKRLTEKRGVRLAAGLEQLLDAYNRPGRKYLNSDARTAVGFACAYDHLGADDVYLFNHMDMSRPTGDDDIFAGDNYKMLLTTLGDREKMLAAPRRCVVTFGDTWMPGEKPRKPLPVTISDAGFEALRIPTGKITAERRVTVILGFECGLSSGTDTEVYADCRKCRPLGKVAPSYPAYEDMDYYAYEVENDGKLPVVTMIEMGTVRGTARIHWAELCID